MPSRIPLARLAWLGLALALLIPTVAFADDDVCRRLYGTEEWARRCDPGDNDWDRAELIAWCRRAYGSDEWTRRCGLLFPNHDPAAYCRRAWGTDAWTRRCAQLDDFDPIAYCRRVWDTPAWTRRCLHLNPPAPTPTIVRPAQVEPVAPVAPAADPAEPTPVPPANTAPPARPSSRP